MIEVIWFSVLCTLATIEAKKPIFERPFTRALSTIFDLKLLAARWKSCPTINLNCSIKVCYRLEYLTRDRDLERAPSSSRSRKTCASRDPRVFRLNFLHPRFWNRASYRESMLAIVLIYYIYIASSTINILVSWLLYTIITFERNRRF